MRFLPLLFLSAVILRAETHQVVPDKYYRTFSHTNPVLKRIQPGDVVITKTLDSGGQDLRGEQVSPGGMFAEGLDWLRFFLTWRERGAERRRARDGGSPPRTMALGDESSADRTPGQES